MITSRTNTVLLVVTNAALILATSLGYALARDPETYSSKPTISPSALAAVLGLLAIAIYALVVSLVFAVRLARHPRREITK